MFVQFFLAQSRTRSTTVCSRAACRRFDYVDDARKWRAPMAARDWAQTLVPYLQEQECGARYP